MADDKQQIDFLKDKSIEAFLLSIEVFNKPTIKYRLEGCVYLTLQCLGTPVKGKTFD